jgi:hypothetical protein
LSCLTSFKSFVTTLLSFTKDFFRDKTDKTDKTEPKGHSASLSSCSPSHTHQGRGQGGLVCLVLCSTGPKVLYEPAQPQQKIFLQTRQTRQTRQQAKTALPHTHTLEGGAPEVGVPCLSCLVLALSKRFVWACQGLQKIFFETRQTRQARQKNSKEHPPSLLPAPVRERA